MVSNKSLKLFFYIFLFTFGFTSVLASESNGTIDSTFKSAKICYDTTCTTGGTINFKPSVVSGINAITIEDSAGIDGHAWSPEIGWINFGPSGSGVTFSNTSTGSTTGFAYSQVAGYINFAPTGYGVRINSNGEFQGYAWTSGQGGGWIKFDCTSGSAYCVKTDWRPVSARTVSVPSGGGGGGGGGLVTDTSATFTGSGDNKYLNQAGVQKQSIDYSNDFRADINDSGIIDLLDFNELIVNWGNEKTVNTALTKKDRCPSANKADINCDGTVDLLDFNLVLVYWGTYVGDQGAILKGSIK